MNWIRKIDWYLQIAIIVAAVCAMPYTNILVLLYAQILLGILQIIGGGIHALLPLQPIYKKAFIRYWIFVFAYFFVSQFFQFTMGKYNTNSEIFFFVLYMPVPWLIATYYLFWYKKLINHIEYHRELEGLIKS